MCACVRASVRVCVFVCVSECACLCMNMCVCVCVHLICISDYDNCKGILCHNNGICIDEIDGYHCSCMTGFIGENCEKGT